MTNTKYLIKDAKVGDKFSHIAYLQYGAGVASVFDYVVIRAGVRDVICNRLIKNGDVYISNDGNPVESRFKRADNFIDLYVIGAQEVTDARKSVRARTRRIKIKNFFEAYKNTEWDEEFLIAAEAFMERALNDPK
jgi:hypothetical protein